MAVSIPSDLIVDVMRNADPQRMRAAVARLQSVSDPQVVAQTSQGSFPSFSDVIAAVQVPPVRTSGSETASARAGFERLVISNMLEGILPPESSGFYGQGNAGEIWRSMFADQLAAVYAEQGRLGIGQLIAKDVVPDAAATQGSWPYFQMAEIKSFVS